jgi:phage terminase large subunit-like protein
VKTAHGRKQPARAQPKKKIKRKARSRPWYFTAAHLKPVPADDPARVYFEHIAENPKQHNRWIHLAARRHVIDLLASVADPDYPYVYDCALAARPSAFAEQFSGLEGPLAGKPLKLLNWQRWIVAMLYGWRHREDPRRRRFNYAYIEVARKNGKTGFVAPLGLYQLGFPPPGARCEVYSVATKLEQANIVWRDGCRLLRTAQGWARLFRERHNRLTHNPSDSDWRPLGADKSTLDGLRPELAIMDELHAWPDRGLWDVINSAFGAAFSPLVLQITTAGDNPEGICMEQQQRVCRMLDSVERGTYTGKEGDAAFYFGAIWTTDATDRWDDPAIWIKANPSLGVVKPMSEMHKLAVGARVSPGARREFLIKQLNCWQTTGPARWLDPAQWARGHPGQAITYPVSWERLRGLPLWCGMDLASTTDTSAFCALAVDPADPERLLCAWQFWLPEADLSDRISRDNQPYDLWAREGWLALTPGPISDVNQIERDIVARLGELAGTVQNFAYDPGWAQGLGQRLQDEHGLPMLICPQRYTQMSTPLDELERRVITATLSHGGNPMATAHAIATTVITGTAGGRLLAKGRSSGRIDGMAALAMAFAARQHSMTAPDQGAGCSWV